jgi:hypothetical protein
MLLDLSLDAVLDIIGHDGMAVLWPEYDDIRQYRGFCIAEIQDVFHARGRLLAQVYAYPSMAPALDAKPHRVWSVDECKHRLDSYLKNTYAMLMVETETGTLHAVAQSADGLIYDPARGVLTCVRGMIREAWVMV